MKVGLNAVYMGVGAGGVGTYLRRLAGAMLHEDPSLRLTLFLSPGGIDELSGEDWWDQVEHVRLPKGADSRWNLAEVMLAVPLLAARRGLDVVHSPANVGPIIAPRVAKVVTLHDLIWLHEPDLVALPKGRRDRMQTLVERSAAGADRIIAGSRATAEDLVQTLRLAPAKIDVVPHGVELPDTTSATPEAELRARLGLGDRRLVLAVAQRRPYKRLDTLVRALAALPDDDVALVLAGAPGPAEDDLRALAAELGVADRVTIPDWLPAEDLEGLYAAATCFVLPSLIEGFGLPILEAMARGVPVACSDVSSLPEVAGDAALLFDPRDQGSVDRALERMLGEPELRERLAKAGRIRAAEFTWSRSARSTLETYGRALGRRGAREAVHAR